MDSYLTVMPMSQELFLSPGETYTGTITVANPQSSTADLTYTASISPYGVSGTDYSVDFTTTTSHTELADWLTLDHTHGTLAPNDTTDITFTIQAPATAAPGGQYAAIKVASEPTAQSTSGVAVNNVYEMTSIIYLNISGEIVREGSVIEQSIPSFVITPVITSTATVTNTGTTHEDALVSFTVTNAFDGSTIYPDTNSSQGINEIIMPDTTRELSYDLINMPAIGLVRVNQTIYYGGETYTIDQTTLICPIWFMVLLVACVLSVATLIFARVRRARRHKYISTV